MQGGGYGAGEGMIARDGKEARYGMEELELEKGRNRERQQRRAGSKRRE